MTVQDKGKSLEHITYLIESLILKNNPSISNDKLIIEKNKIISVNETRYEVDVYVNINLEDNYNSIFLFECKNWDSIKVGKNDIVAFIDKINILDAQRGYLIAQRFTKDAINKAKECSKLKLLLFSKNKDNFSGINPLQSITYGLIKCKDGAIRQFDIKKITTFYGKTTNITKLISEGEISFEDCEASLNNKTINANKYIYSLCKETYEEFINNHKFNLLEKGILTFKKEINLDKEELIINSNKINKIKIELLVPIYSEYTPPKFMFNIPERGSVIEFEPSLLLSNKNLSFKIIKNKEQNKFGFILDKHLKD